MLRNSTIHFRMYLYLLTCLVSHGFISVPVTTSNNLVRSYPDNNRDKLEQNLCIVSMILFLLGNLFYEQGIKFRDLLRNHNKLIQ